MHRIFLMADFNIIYGKRSCVEALRSDMPIKDLRIANNLERDSLVTDILRKASQKGVKVKEVPRKSLDELCGDSQCNHQGVVLQVEPYSYAGIGDILAAANDSSERHDGRALVVICDHITDAGNLGAIARSAESVGASGMIIPNKRSAQVTPTTYKTSAGAITHLNIAMVPNLKSAINELKEAGFWVVAATEDANDLLWEADLEGRIAIVLGNEQNGISELVLKNSDIFCKLPQVGQISSLNVAQASTVFMYEWLRQNIG